VRPGYTPQTMDEDDHYEEESDASYEEDEDGLHAHGRKQNIRLGKAGRAPRVAKACEACKQSRRKCSGETPCGVCVKRGVEVCGRPGGLHVRIRVSGAGGRRGTHPRCPSG
jgi:hypothetical protein